MKKYLTIAVAALVLAGLLLGCKASPSTTSSPAASAPAKAPSAAPSAAPASAAVAPAKVIKWKLNTDSALNSDHGKAQVDFANEVQKNSGGRLIIEVHPSSELGYKSAEMLRVVKQQLVDVAAANHSHFETDEPMMSLMDLPFLWKSPKQVENASPIAAPYFQKVLDKWDVINLWNVRMPFLGVFCKKSVATVDEFSKFKYRSQSPTVTNIIKALGGSAVTIDLGEAYTAMSTGVIDGGIWSTHSYIDRKFYEVAPFFANWNISTAGYCEVVSRKSFEALPKDLQDIVIAAAKKNEAQMWKDIFWVANQELDWLRKQPGCKVQEITASEIDKASSKIGTVYDDWLKRAGADGKTALEGVRNAPTQ